MTIRTTNKTVIFENSFTLGNFSEVLPPGRYEFEIDEELLEGVSFHAYRRILAHIHLPTKSGQPGISRTLTINPNELDAALDRDSASGTKFPQRREATNGTSEPREGETDRRAVDRAEDEGMVAHRN